MTRILVVEDHLIVQEALVALLGAQPDLQIVGTAANMKDAQVLLDQTMPDILLLDLSLQDGGGLELARALSRSRSNTRVLVLTGFPDGFAAAEAMSAGVAGYVLKEQPTADLFAAIDAIRRGGTYVAPKIAAQLSPDQLAPKQGSPLQRLSGRESQVFRLIVGGTTSDALSRQLAISVKTVETHRTNIARKLGVHTTADFVRFGAAHGMAIAPRGAQKGSTVGKESSPTQDAEALRPSDTRGPTSGE